MIKITKNKTEYCNIGTTEVGWIDTKPLVGEWRWCWSKGTMCFNSYKDRQRYIKFTRLRAQCWHGGRFVWSEFYDLLNYRLNPFKILERW